MSIVNCCLTILLSVTTLTSHPLLQQANIGVDIRRLETGEVVEQYRPERVIAPASVMKLMTTACALEVLGADFRFQTPLLYDGYNLYIVGSCDPSFGSEKCGKSSKSGHVLAEYLRAVQRAGITRVRGGVVADLSLLDADAVNPAWLYEDIGNYYAPGIFAINWLDNTTNYVLQSGPVGSMAEVLRTEPRQTDLRFINHIRCTQTTEDGAFIHGIPFSNERYLCGSVPSNRGTFGVKGDIPNPGLLMAQQFTQMLRKAGIEVEGEATYSTLPQSLRRPMDTLCVHQSDSLAVLVRETNQHSNNLYAEALFRYLGTRFGTPGTIAHSQDYVRNYWSRRGITMTSARIQDGCGLAPQDAISAQMFTALLRYMDRSPLREAWWSSLPVSGESGTLVGLGRETALQGKIHAKSGTISGTKNFAGYMTTASGDTLVFSVLVNSAACKARKIQSVIQAYLLEVYREN